MLETKNDRFCLLAEPVVLESCFGFVERNLSLAFTGFRPVFASFRNTRGFTGAAPQIIKLRTTNGALAHDGTDVDVRRHTPVDTPYTPDERTFQPGNTPNPP